MDEGVDAINPVEENWMSKEPLLKRYFPEDMQLLFDMNELKGMFASNVDSALDNCDCGESST